MKMNIFQIAQLLTKQNCIILPGGKLLKCRKKFFMHQFHNEIQAKEILKINESIPISRQANILSSFSERLNYTLTDENGSFEVLPETTHTFTFTDILNGFDSDSFPQHKEVENYFKRLLSHVIFQLFRKKGLWKTELSSKKLCVLSTFI